MIEILLPVYNGEKYLAEQIESILNQTNRDWILKIRNDGSTDGSQMIINEYCRTHSAQILDVTKEPENIGLIKSLNELSNEEPHGDYMMFADQDDVWLPNKIQLTMEKLKCCENSNQNEPIMICTDAICVDESLNVISKSFFASQKFPADTFGDINRMIALNVIQGCTIILNRHAANIAFPIPAFMNVHDMYIGVSVRSSGVVEYLHKPTLLYRQHSHNELGSKEISLKYYMMRCLSAISTLRMIYRLRKYLPVRISMGKIIRYKFYYAYKRIITKTI